MSECPMVRIKFPKLQAGARWDKMDIISDNPNR
jgi:hypothetical protein